jgi:ABC-type dipeptide/oligopeptide/nickel transport system permease component
MLRWLLTVPAIMLGVALIAFLLVHLTPGDPARVIAGEAATSDTVEAIRISLGLDKPLWVQFGLFLQRLSRGDLGRSIATHQPVLTELRNRLPVTIKLGLTSSIFGVVTGVFLGTFAATRRGTWLDTLVMSGSVAGLSAPSFWLGLMLMYYFCIVLPLFPVAGWGSPTAMVLPVITMGTHHMAVMARLSRSTMLEVLGEDYIRTARAKGLAERVVLYKHALRNASIPVITVVGVQFSVMLGGAVVVETVFSIPGVGRYLIQAIMSKDFPVVQGGLMLVAGFSVLVAGVVDLVYVLIDPRIRVK